MSGEPEGKGGEKPTVFIGSLGFTGTQKGMTSLQFERLHQLLLESNEIYFHHGDCVGADAQAHKIAREYNYEVVIHPPIDNRKRAMCVGAARTFAPKPYLQRNHDIVDNTERLIAVPGQDYEVQRSGTWATVRYAMKQGKEVTIVYPDGTTERR